jgi:hypothetical protein
MAKMMMRLVVLAMVVAAVASCGGPATQLEGTWQVGQASLTVRDQFDGSGNLPATDEEETFPAEDAGTMTFAATPTSPGEFTFTRSLTKVLTRAGFEEDRVIEFDPPQEVSVGYDVTGEEDAIVVYDGDEDWNGEFAVSGGFGSMRLERTRRFDFSPTQRQFFTFVYELSR